MPTDVVLPKLGLTMQEATIDQWLVEPGASVASGEPLMRLATDKVEVEVEAEGDGRFYPAVVTGTVLPPGAVVGWLLAEGEQPPAEVAAGVPAAHPGDHGARPAVGPSELSPADSRSTGRLRSSPYARRRARDLGIDLSAVVGSGPRGRIVAHDVETVATASAAPPAAWAATASSPGGTVTSPLVRRHAAALDVDLSAVAASGPGGRIQRADVVEAARHGSVLPDHDEARYASTVPLTGMRGAIARAMHTSLHEMAQLTEAREIDVTRLVRLRADLKDEAEAGERVPTVTDFVARAAALALAEHPMLNATVDGEYIRTYRHVRIGIAIALPHGLVVPVVDDVTRGSLYAVARETRRLAAAARNGGLTSHDMTGPTFTVTSLGARGIDFFTPIVNPGNSGILGVGRIRDGVRWEGDCPKRTSVMTLSLSFDHRVVDGAEAAGYLLAVERRLERPLALLAGTE